MAKHLAAKAEAENATSEMNLFPIKWNVIDDPLGFELIRHKNEFYLFLM